MSKRREDATPWRDGTAPDVLAARPDAVSRDASGFYRVNYGKLGIAMTEAA